MSDDTTKSVGTLFVVATPIGNLSDITRRALSVLCDANLVIAEDTRRAQKLLNHFDIETPIESFHEHSDEKKLQHLLELLQRGRRLALTTDSGTPTVSDPGCKLVDGAWDRGIHVTPVPGPSAVISAMAASGFNADSFTFAGYPPRKRNQRREFYAEISRSEVPVVVFESPHRLRASVEDAAAEIPSDHPVLIAREMTKQFEELTRRTLGEIRDYYDKGEVKGEFTMVFGPASPKPGPQAAPPQAELIRMLAESCLSTKKAARILSTATDISRNEAYDMLINAPVND